jgi:hypothetical protein
MNRGTDQREAAWERYRDGVPMRRVMKNPEPGDVRLAFEAGYNVAALDLEPFESLVRAWREKAQEIREAGDAGPVMLAIAEELLIRSDDLEHRDRQSTRVGSRRARETPETFAGSRTCETMADEYTLGDIVRLIDGLAESTQAGFQRVEGRLERIETRLDRIDDKLDRHGKRIEALEARP